MGKELSITNREDIRQRYLHVDTSNVADVLDNLNVSNQGLAPEFTPFPADAGQLAGWAYTIRGQNTPFPLGGDADKMAACQGTSAGDITVWSGDGDGTCYFGELIAIGMKERGCVGALIDGGIRDVRWLKKQGFPVFARYRSPVQSIGRWKVNACQVPVFLRGATVKYVTVNPGDFILADEDGAIVIPQHLVVQVLEEAERLTNIEVAIRSELAQGLSLSEALKKFGHV
ncbi:RraA family protein [Paraburkholderia caribensis]|uniref:RraA family protein n=1 Tax=Paraburkholderia caribensis TaxID=75105 RepID=UPI00078C4B04|nr:RraA family protein [Paraburkholderia caribensis]AMV48465.1 aldolase [Paraburkholderia caribensis]